MTAFTTSLDLAATVGAELALVLCAALLVLAAVAAALWAVLARRERGRR